MHNSTVFFICPVCGFDRLTEPAYDNFGCASFDICPCCGTEFGYDDVKYLHTELRNVWISNGMKWWSSNMAPPDNWSPVAQINKLSK